MKVVINKCYGGFSLSRKGEIKYLEKKGIAPYFYKEKDTGLKNTYQKITETEYCDIKSWHGIILTKDLGDMTDPDSISNNYFWSRKIERNDPLLVELVEEMGEECFSDYASLEVIEIPDDVEWEVDEYDGMERIVEKHRSWS